MATSPSRESAGRDVARPARAPSFATNGAASADSFTFTFDGEELHARPGDTLAVALMAAGRRTLRTTSRLAEPRGLFCNMGVCFECLVEVDGRSNIRACQTLVERGMQVRTQHGHGRSDDGAQD